MYVLMVNLFILIFNCLYNLKVFLNFLQFQFLLKLITIQYILSY